MTKMTDTVNVPREWLRDVFLVLSDWKTPLGEKLFFDTGAMLAAAPKAELVSDPYKLEFEPCYGCGANEPSERCLGCSHDFQVLNRQETIDSSEAPKVEQEPDGWFGSGWYDLGGKRHTRPDLIAREQLDINKVSEGPFNLYRHPAPASDELLEALKPFAEAAVDLDDGETGHIWERPAAMNIDASDLRRAADLIAKHKGPQS